MESPCIILQVQIGTGKGDQQQNSATRPGIFATWKPGEAAFDNRMAIQIQRLARESTDVGLSISQPSWGGYSTQVLIFKTIDTSLLLTSRGKVGVERRETIFRVPRRQMAAFWANSSDNKMQQGYDYDAVVMELDRMVWLLQSELRSTVFRPCSSGEAAK
jgi:hypothetical protein